MVAYLKVLVTVLVVMLASQCAFAKFNIKKIMKHFQDLEMKGVEHEEEAAPKAIRKFSFQNCGPASDPMKVKDLSVTPDPMVLPGNITFSGEAAFGINVTEPLTVSIAREAFLDLISCHEDI